MHRNTFCTIVLTVLLVFMGACNDSEWDSVPGPIRDFISEYFPQGEVTSVIDTADGGYTVQIHNGATLSFDKEYAWTDINGNGIPLPAQFLFDELPEALYNYLVEMEQTTSVYHATRNYLVIDLMLLNSTVSYEIATGKITYPSATTA